MRYMPRTARRRLCLLVRADRRVRDRAVYLPHDLPDLPRRGAAGPSCAGAFPRRRLGHEGAAGGARDSVIADRLFHIEPVLFGGYFGGAIQVLPAHDVVAELGREWHGAGAFALRRLPVPMWLAALGVLTAWVFVLRRPQWAMRCAGARAGSYRVLVNKYYFDWFNENVIAPLARGTGRPAVARRRSGRHRRRHGQRLGSRRSAGSRAACGAAERLLYSYAFWMIIGLALLLGWFLVRI